ncbi:MAG: hypothetical protein R2874_05210 [Desulfobacterales bacterium]
MTGPVFSKWVNTMIGEWMQQSGTAGGGTGKFNFDSWIKMRLPSGKPSTTTRFANFQSAQLGLMEHQERVAWFLDRFTLLETALAEFLVSFSIPFKQSLTTSKKN